MEVVYLWLIFGAILVAVEVAGAPGIGLFFAGMASLCVGVLIQSGLVGPELYIAQFAWFFALTCVWAALLWKPLRRWLNRGPKSAFTDIVGADAVVGAGGLKKGVEGEAQWSGTTMKAELCGACSVLEVAPGARVRIVEVRGAKLIVEPY